MKGLAVHTILFLHSGLLLWLGASLTCDAQMDGEDEREYLLQLEDLPGLASSLPQKQINEAGAPYEIKVPPFSTLSPSVTLNQREAQEAIHRARLREILLEARNLNRTNEGSRAVAKLESALPQYDQPKLKAMILSHLVAYAFNAHDYDRALKYSRKLNTLDPANLSISSKCNLAGILMSRGEYDEAQRLLENIDVEEIENADLKWAVHFNRACLYSLTGREGAAVEHFQKAYGADPLATQISAGDPQLDAIRDDPIFNLLTGRLAIVPVAREVSARPIQLDSYPYRNEAGERNALAVQPPASPGKEP